MNSDPLPQRDSAIPPADPSTPIGSRAELVHAILNFQGGLGALCRAFEPFRGYSAGEPVPLTPRHIISVLERFQAGEFSAGYVTSWAELVESLGEIGEGGDGAALFQIIGELEDYDMRGFPLTPSTVVSYIKRCKALLREFYSHRPE